MVFDNNGEYWRGAFAHYNMLGTDTPLEYTGARDEYLACRRSAWLGGALNCSPVYDVWGTDAAAVLTYTFVNRDFSLMEPGQSKHGIICNENGNMMADGVIMYRGDNLWRSYWLAPVLQYFVEKAEKEGKDIHGEYREDEYFFQIDGPKSLEILEEATQTDLHDIKFGKHRIVQICGTEMVVHRLGMSGCLAYEVHGHERDKEIAYAKLREVVEKNDGRALGFRQYIVLNHTPGGYPNQFQHFLYDFRRNDPEFVEFTQKNCFPQFGLGSAINDQEMYYATPYDIGWGKMVNLKHDFMAKDALMAAKEGPRRQAVTLEWNDDDVAAVFQENFKGKGSHNYAPIEAYHDAYNASMPIPCSGYYVKDGDKVIGITTGRCYAFYEKRMISLAFIQGDYAVEGKEYTVVFGQPGFENVDIRVKVAQFPYYNEEYRNETFDTENIPHPDFEAMNNARPEGRYEVVAKSIMGENPGAFEYAIDGDTLTGTAFAMGQSVPVENGKVDGSKFSHTMTMMTPMGEMTMPVSGEVYGDRINGVMGEGMTAMPFVGYRK